MIMNISIDDINSWKNERNSPFRIEQKSIKKLLNQFVENHSDTSEKIIVPEHQRKVISTSEWARNIIYTIFNGFPLPHILLSQNIENNRIYYSLEDGLQRMNAISQFYHSEVFNDLDQENKNIFLDYEISIVILIDISPEITKQIFMFYNKGNKMSDGEIYHANISENGIYNICDYATCFEDDFTEQFRRLGFIKKQDTKSNTRYSNLKKYVEFSHTFAFVENDKWGDVMTEQSDQIIKTIQRPINLNTTRTRIQSYLNFMEKMICKLNIETKYIHNVIIDFGIIGGVYLYNIEMSKYQREKSINFQDVIDKANNFEELKAVINYKCPSSRMWNRKRWDNGLDSLKSYLENQIFYNQELGQIEIS